MGPGAWRHKKTVGLCYATFTYPAGIVMQIVSSTQKKRVNREKEEKKAELEKKGKYMALKGNNYMLVKG